MREYRIYFDSISIDILHFTCHFYFLRKEKVFGELERTYSRATDQLIYSSNYFAS